MERTKRLVAIIAAGTLLFGCGGSGPEVEPTDAVPSDNLNPNRPVDPVEEVDYQGFTVAPPPAAEGPGNEKDSFDEKLAALVESTKVPSAFGGAFFRLGRAYLSGREPITQIEVAAFDILDQASPEMIETLARTLDAIDALPPEDVETLYGLGFIQARPEDPLTHSILTNAVSREIKTYASINEFGETDIEEMPLEEERPGLVREWTCPDIDGAYGAPCPNVCTIETPSLRAEGAIRTATFQPPLSGWDYEDREREQTLTYDEKGNPVWLNPQPPQCKGATGDIDGNPVCLAVPVALAGETVRLEGFNFHDVNAAIRLSNGFSTIIEIDAHVRGGRPSFEGLSELGLGGLGSAGEASVGGSSSDGEGPSGTAPATCNAGDVIHFQIPEDLQPGIYGVDVVVDNPENIIPGSILSSTTATFIQIVSPPESTRFQFASEQLSAFAQTDGEWGSDEIGVMVTVIPVSTSGGEVVLGELQKAEFEFGDVDRGERRCMGDADASGQCIGRTLFTGTAGGSFGYVIDGFEIDNRKAYKEQITEWSKLYDEITKSGWGVVSTAVGAAVGAIVGVVATPAIGAAVGTVVAAGINTVVAMWAPADRVIQDSGGRSYMELDELTSPLVQTPLPREYTTADGVDVLVEPCEDTDDKDRPECSANAKGPGEYRESRRYAVDRSGDCPLSQDNCLPYNGGSLYQLTFRYNRVN